MTNQIISHFKNILKNNVNQPDLIRLAVHSSFFELYKSGKYLDLQSFYQAYFDRVKKFFQCQTIQFDKALEIVNCACNQIMNSGLFNSDHITLLELHLTNRCNLDCSWCTYKSKDEKQSVLFQDLEYIKELSPMEILIAGGGEPTLFSDNGYVFNDVILFLRNNLPGARLRLITNGTVIPKGDWLSMIDEISVSLDDECPKSFLANKGRDLFNTVWHNIQTYLYDSSISIIRVTKIFNQQNLIKSIYLAKKLFLLWNKIPPTSIKRNYFRFMIFPMADDQNQSMTYIASQVTNVQKEIWMNMLSDIKNSKPDFYCFLKNNTNLLDLVNANLAISSAEKCWPVTHYLLIGADRKIYPCFVTCSNFQATTIGELGTPIRSLTKSRANLFYYPPLRCRSGCRPANVFYGLQSKNYYLAQENLRLCVTQKEHSDQPQLIHVSYHDPNHLLGGQGWAVYNLCKEQVKCGNPVYWLSPCIKQEQPGEYLYENGLLRVIKIKFTKETVNTLFANDDVTQSFRIKFGEFAVVFIKKYFKPQSCIIHLHGFIETPRLAGKLRELGYRAMSTFHMLLSARNMQLHSDPEIIEKLRSLEKLAIDSNTVITVPSTGMIEELREIHPDYTGVIKCIPNGVGDEYVTTPIHTISPLKKTIVSYGRISPEKGFDLLIVAAKLLFENMSEEERSLIQVSIFGNTDSTIEARRAYANSLIKNAEEYSNIAIIASPSGCVGAEKLSLIDKADFGVVLSLYEPFGMVIPELMARGKPVVTTLTTGTRDILQTNQIGRNDFGLTVEPNAISISEALKWMLNHPSEVKIMGENALERARHYRWNSVAEQFNQLYLQNQCNPK